MRLHMRGLRKGWHYGEGEAIPDAVMDKAIEFENLLITDAYVESYPMLDGKIKVCVGTDTNEVQFMIGEKGIEKISIEEEI